MSGYKSFAVWGAGAVGKPIVAELLKAKAAGTIDVVTILTRPESVNNEANKGYAAQGAKIIPFDPNSADASAQLRGIDVLISAVREALPDQPKAILAAQKADVKLFVPSEWGDDTDVMAKNVPKSEYLQNVVVGRTQAKNIGLPFATFFCGPWPEYHPFFGFDVKNGNITIYGEGTIPVSHTTIPDVARFVVFALTTLPRDQIENAIFRIEGDRISFKDLADAYIKASGRDDITVTHVPLAGIKAKVDEDPSIGPTLLYGRAVYGVVAPTPEETSNKLWPEWNPRKAVDVLLSLTQAA